MLDLKPNVRESGADLRSISNCVARLEIENDDYGVAKSIEMLLPTQIQVCLDNAKCLRTQLEQL